MQIMEATAGRLLAKEGAEGVICVAAVNEDWGLAIKVEDGTIRAVGPATVELLNWAGLLRDGELTALEGLRRARVENTLGEQVGHVYVRLAG